MLEVAFGAFALTLLLFGLLAWLAKSLLSQWMDRDISHHRSQLEAEARLAINNYRTALEKDRIRLQISHRGIFEKQANAITELYRLLVELERSIQPAVYDLQREQSPQEHFINSWRELSYFHDLNRILLPESVNDMLDDFIRAAFHSVSDGWSIERLLAIQHPLTDKTLEEVLTLQKKLCSELTQLARMKSILCEKLRELLGAQAF